MNQVPNGLATEIVRGEILVLIPFRSRLFDDSGFNISLKLLTPKILHIEYRAVGPEFLLEHGTEFAG
jgi:hypothetical protein